MGECFYLKDLQLYKDKDEYNIERYYLKAIYEKVTKYKKERVTIPKILLPVNTGEPIIKQEISDNRYSDNTIDIGFGYLPVQYDIIEPRNMTKGTMLIEVLEEYPQKMTMEEIEKRLGHKVEIVSGK